MRARRGLGAAMGDGIASRILRAASLRLAIAANWRAAKAANAAEACRGHHALPKGADRGHKQRPPR